MAKRRKEDADQMSDDGEEAAPVEVIDVDFDFFDLSAEVDYHALSNLLKQLFSHDALVFDIGKLVDLMLAQKYVGSTVKCDGPESDPYAFASVINLNDRRSDPAVTTLLNYVVEKAGSSALHAQLEQLLANTGADGHVGLVLSERLVNMPPQIATPLYRMLNEELQWARDEKEPYNFSHLLFLSRVFVPQGEEADGRPPTVPAKKKKASKTETSDVFAYHAEDEVIGKFCESTVDFTHTNTPDRDAVDPFGVETRGRLMLMPADKLGEMAEEMERWMAG